MNVAKMRMLISGKTRNDKIQTEHIYETVIVVQTEYKMRENRLRLFGHIQCKPLIATLMKCDSININNPTRGRGRPNYYHGQQ